MTARKILSDSEIKCREGDFFDFKHYSILVNVDIDVYTESGKLLFSLRKKIIPTEVSNIARTYLLPRTKKCRTNSRGIASGKVDISKMTPGVVEILNPGKFQTHVRYVNGNVSNYKVCNTVKSTVAGYYDKPKRGSLHFGPIRLTAFSEKYINEWNNSILYVQYLDYLYSLLLKEDYILRKTKADNIKYGMIPGTIFTTLTLNYNFRTACHIDKGDVGYSLLTSVGTWNGCYLGFPQYGLAIHVEEGDLLIMDPHEYHCNTEFIGDGVQDRMSIVTYSREKIINQHDFSSQLVTSIL